jgi:hypothetical protein
MVKRKSDKNYKNRNNIIMNMNILLSLLMFSLQFIVLDIQLPGLPVVLLFI